MADASIEVRVEILRYAQDDSGRGWDTLSESLRAKAVGLAAETGSSMLRPYKPRRV
jgi:hypothetical protein